MSPRASASGANGKLYFVSIARSQSVPARFAPVNGCSTTSCHVFPAASRRRSVKVVIKAGGWHVPFWDRDNSSTIFEGDRVCVQGAQPRGMQGESAAACKFQSQVLWCYCCGSAHCAMRCSETRHAAPRAAAAQWGFTPSVLTRMGCLGSARLLARLGRDLCRRRRTLSRPGAHARSLSIRPKL